MPFTNIKLWMGPETHQIPTELFSLNRLRLATSLKNHTSSCRTIVVLQGGKDLHLFNTDMLYEFRQESYFRWAFGVSESGCYGTIDVDTCTSTLFIPRYPESYAIWMGPLHSPDEFKEKYGVDRVYYVDEMARVLQELNPSIIMILKGTNSDSGLETEDVHFDEMYSFNIDKKILYPIISNLRAIKTHLELDVLCYVARVSSAAHRKVMRLVEAGKKEYELESEFLHYVYSVGGCRHVSYTSICCSGPNAAILHYGHAGAPNDRILKDGDICLFDMGANYFGYAADITCTFPVNGKFTADQKLIYEAVLASNLAVAKEVKPGVSWACMHVLANRVLLAALKDGGLLQGDVSEMVTAGIGAIFQPHGLGHFIGLDVHDVGGYLPDNPPRPTQPPGTEKLRTARILEAGMVLTIEPGCYFINCLLDSALEDHILSQFLMPNELNRFRGFGGVRIEDTVIVTETGNTNITTVPRTVDEIEKWMAKQSD